MCKDVKLANGGRYLGGGRHDWQLKGDWSETGKNIPFSYFSRETLDLFGIILLLSLPTFRHSVTVGAYAAPASQFASQILGGFGHVFRLHIPDGRRVDRASFSDISQDLLTGKQRLAAHCFVPATQEWQTQRYRLPKELRSCDCDEGSAWRSRRDRSPE